MRTTTNIAIKDPGISSFLYLLWNRPIPTLLEPHSVDLMLGNLSDTGNFRGLCAAGSTSR